MTDHDWPEFELYLLRDCGYSHTTELGDTGHYIALVPKLFTTQLVLGIIGDHTGLLDGWCYQSRSDAAAALQHWQSQPDLAEPIGWFRHPSTGRRIARAPGEIDDRGREIPVGQEYHRA